ncbi:hypothetical protein T06_6203 [Trichinella sp. T6]|nr:hypothetical protein T06_6203 [Trichinella sp. T6]
MVWGVSLYRRQLVEPNFQINQTLLCIARTIDALQALFGLLIQRWSIFRAHFPGTLDRPLASHRCPVSLNVVYNMLHSLDVLRPGVEIMSSWDGNMCWEWVRDSSDLDQTRVEIVIIWPSISADQGQSFVVVVAALPYRGRRSLSGPAAIQWPYAGVKGAAISARFPFPAVPCPKADVLTTPDSRRRSKFISATDHGLITLAAARSCFTCQRWLPVQLHTASSTSGSFSRPCAQQNPCLLLFNFHSQWRVVVEYFPGFLLLLFFLLIKNPHIAINPTTSVRNSPTQPAFG